MPELPLTKEPEPGQGLAIAPVRTFTLPDWLRRALRTALQAFIGTLLAQWAALAVAPGDVPAWSILQRVAIAAAVAALIAFLTALQNVLEDTSGVALLKAKPGEVTPK